MTDTVFVRLEVEEGTLKNELLEVIEHRMGEVKDSELITDLDRLAFDEMKISALREQLKEQGGSVE